MFDLLHQWGKRMAKVASRAVSRRVCEEPRVSLIPVVDQSDDDVQRRLEVHAMLATMVLDLHKRGRPAKRVEEEGSHAA